MIKQYKLRFYNFRLVVFLLAISFIGIHLVGTAADYLRTRQLLGVIIGVVFMLTAFTDGLLLVAEFSMDHVWF